MKKYNNIITNYKGQKFDSKAEVTYLQMLENLPQIKEIKTQVRYPLLNMEGKKRLAYIVDFEVITEAGNEYLIELKGCLTAANVVKMSYFQFVYKKKVHVVRTSGLKKFDVSFII